MTSKEKETIIRLLQLYKELSYIWDRRDSNFKNKKLRNKGKELLLEVYKEIEPEATIKSLAKKISNLRTNFITELRKVKRSLSSSTNPDHIYTPSLYYYDSLSFLGDIDQYSSDRSYYVSSDPLESGQYLSPQPSDDEIDRNGADDSESAASLKTSKIKILSFSDEPECKKPRTAESYLYDDSANTSMEVGMTEEELMVIGKSIAIQLRDVDRNQQAIAQKLISDAIYYAKFGRLSEISYIELGCSSD